MAESGNNNLNTINFLAATGNGDVAAKLQQAQFQQMMAQQLMAESMKQDNPAQLANPGGLVIRNSPIGGLAKALTGVAGAYMNKSAMADMLDAYKGNKPTQSPDQSPDGQGGQPLLPWQSQAKATGNALSVGDNNPINSPYAMLDPSIALKAQFDYNAPTNEQKNFRDPAMHDLIQGDLQNKGLVNVNGHMQPASTLYSNNSPSASISVPVSSGRNEASLPTQPPAAGASDFLTTLSPTTPVTLNTGGKDNVDWNQPDQAAVAKKYADDTPENLKQINSTGEKAKNLSRMLDAADAIEKGDIYEGNTSKIREDIGNTISSLGLGNDALKDTVSRTQAARAIYKQAMMDDKALSTEGKTGGIQIRNQQEFNFVKEGYPNLEQLPEGRDVIKKVVRGELQRAVNAQDVANNYGKSVLDGGYYKQVAQKNAQIPSVDVSGLKLPKSTSPNFTATATGPNGHKIGQKADGSWVDFNTGVPIQ